MTRARTSTVAAAAIAVGLAVAGCSGGGSGGEPGLDRIDGPAQVDPDVVVGGAGPSTDDSDG